MQMYKILSAFFRLADTLSLRWHMIRPQGLICFLCLCSVHPSALNFRWFSWHPPPQSHLGHGPSRAPSSLTSLASHFTFLYIRNVKLQPGLSTFLLFGSVLLVKCPLGRRLPWPLSLFLCWFRILFSLLPGLYLFCNYTDHSVYGIMYVCVLFSSTGWGRRLRLLHCLSPCLAKDGAGLAPWCHTCLL